MNIDLTTPKLVYRCRCFQNIGYKLRHRRYISDRRTTMAANARVIFITFFWQWYNSFFTLYLYILLLNYLFWIINQLEKLEAAKAAWLVYLSLLSLTGPHWALTGLTGPYWSLHGLTGGLTGPYWAFFAFDDGLTEERTLRLIGLLSQPKNKRKTMTVQPDD